MKVAIISDIHGNLEALDAVLRDIASERCARTYCLGDVVGYGPTPNQVCARLRELGIQTILGNHDEAAALEIPLPEAVLNPLAFQSLQWTRKVLLPEHRQWLRALPRSIQLPEFDASLHHANPQNPRGWEYITSRYQAWEVLENQTETVCLIGHTHRPYVCVLHDGYVIEQRPDVIRVKPGVRHLVNVGSVGQPRNRDPRSSYAILDGDDQTILFKQVDYPISITQRRIREQELPDRLAERLAFGI